MFKGEVFVSRQTEEILHGFQGIKEVVVYPEGEILKAIVSYRRNYKLNPEELNSYCEAFLPGILLPIHFKLLVICCIAPVVSDITLFCDTLKLVPLLLVKSNQYFIGPVHWSPKINIPVWDKPFDESKP